MHTMYYSHPSWVVGGECFGTPKCNKKSCVLLYYTQAHPRVAIVLGVSFFALAANLAFVGSF